jgi:hypothetical protein
MIGQDEPGRRGKNLLKGEHMNRTVVFTLIFYMLVTLIVCQPVQAKKINSYEEMYTLLPGGMSLFEANRAVIENAQKLVSERQMLRKRRTIRFIKPMGLDVMNEKYISLAFDVQIIPRKSAVFSLLFETNGENPVTFPNTIYLHWVGPNDLKLFSEMTMDTLYKSYQEMGVEDCKPGFMRTGMEKALLGKADINHTHDVSVLVSGTIPEARIDDSIARDKEVGDAIRAYVTNLEKRIDQLERKLANVNEILNGVSRTNGTITFSNVNLQLVNGRGATAETNGKGNLIVGYNEYRGGGDARSGSHNIIVGSKNSYSSYGGIVSGASNDIAGRYASVIGGHNNYAVGEFSTITGGAKNNAKGKYTSINGQSDRTKVGNTENPHFKNN